MDPLASHSSGGARVFAALANVCVAAPPIRSAIDMVTTMALV